MVWLNRDRDRFREAVELEFRNLPGTIQEQVCKRPIPYHPERVRRDIDNLKAALAGTSVTEAFHTAVARPLHDPRPVARRLRASWSDTCHMGS
jgi:5-methyltetrahydropteroyltriglutamate--homocysteine methyltransferase